jgi:outer membrane immunogenic protein
MKKAAVRIAARIAALIVLIGTPALAADLPMRAPVPLAAPTRSWTGFYFGADGGYGWGADNSTITYTNSFGRTATSAGPKARGGFGGGNVGYNWQTGSIVLGVEADIQGSGVGDSVSGITSDGITAFTASQKLTWFGTACGRIGIAVDRALLYVTGGYAYGRVADVAQFSIPGGLSTLMTHSTNRNGATIGGGIEYYVAPNWSVKAEYEYLDLGSESLFGAVVPPVGVTITTSAIKDRFSTARFGVNFHFD